MLRRLAFVILPICMWLAACATSGPISSKDSGHVDEIAALARAIRGLGPGVDPQEAQRAAWIAYHYTDELAEAYEITDPPLIHNTKVNMGLRPRGLCWHWAEDIEARLNAERFRTLTMHRAIANADNPILIDHSTSIISATGEGLFDGIVLDPWRYGGVLFWSPVLEDTRYTWVPRDTVLDRKRQRMLRAAG